MYPIKLTEQLELSEGNLIGCMWKNPEFYAEYSLNKNELSDDGLFYYGLGEILFKLNHTTFDKMAVYSVIMDNDVLKTSWEVRGGYNTIDEMLSTVDINNIDAYYDAYNKYTLLKKLYDKGFNIEREFDKFKKMNTQQIYDYMEYQLNSITIDTVSSLEFEDLNITDKEVEEMLSGEEVGISYAKHSPLLNYLTMGLPKGDLTMVGSYTNGGKSSYLTANMIIPIAEQKKKCCLVSNEQRSIVYKRLLMEYVLTERLNCYSIPRKKLKSGKLTDDEMKLFNRAREIIKEEYAPYITFIKMYDYDMGKVKKIVKKLSKVGLEVLIYDTMKYGGEDDSVWLSLLQDSKDLFQICSKENVAGLVSLQLALHTKNKVRFLDESTLANGKQIAEVFSEIVLFRDIWDDEYNGEPFDIKPFRFIKDANGKFTNIKEEIILDKDKKYKVFFLSKTRNDENNVAILYEYQGHINRWKEIAKCTPSQKNRY